MEVTTSPEIQITSVLFKHNATQIKFESIPKYITYKGRRYTLVQASED